MKEKRKNEMKKPGQTLFHFEIFFSPTVSDITFIVTVVVTFTVIFTFFFGSFLQGKWR